MPDPHPAPWPTATIRIFPASAPGAYPVELALPDGPQLPPGVARIDLGALTALATDVPGYGQLLGEALFAQGALGPAYREALAAHAGRLAVRLRVDDEGLADLAWERALQPRDGGWAPLAATAATPLARLIPAAGWALPAPAAGRPPRLLLAIASPAGLERYGLDPIDPAEIAATAALFAALPGVELTTMASGGPRPPSLTALAAELASGYDMLHLVCHGLRAGGESALFLEPGPAGGPRTPGAELVAQLRALARPPRLVALVACESAARASADAHPALGAAIVRDGGAPICLAMAGQVGVAAARQLTAQLYARLLAHGRADLALSEARALISDPWDWGAPVLFTRLSEPIVLVPPAAAAPTAEDPTQALVAALLECDCVADPHDRQQLIAALRRADRGLDVRYSSSSRVHVHNLVAACRKAPGRLERLAAAVRELEGETDAAARVAAAAARLVAS